MSSQNPLGFMLNLGRNASGGTNRARMGEPASSILFVVDTPGNASTLTITEATASTGGTSQALASGIQQYWSQTAGVWTLVTTGISNAVITVSGTPDQIAVWVNQGALSDGFSYIQGVHSAKATTYVLSPLNVQRRPTNLVNVYS